MIGCSHRQLTHCMRDPSKDSVQSSGRILISNPIQSKWSPGDLVSTWLMLPIIYGGHRIWFFWQYKQFFVHIEVNLNSPLRAPLQIFQHNKKLNWISTRSTTYLDIVKNCIIKLKFISSARSDAIIHYNMINATQGNFEQLMQGT